MSRISSNCKPTILGPSFDEYIDPGAASYVIHFDDAAALDYLTDAVIEGMPESALPSERSALAGKVEWWVRERYSHIGSPSPERH